MWYSCTVSIGSWHSVADGITGADLGCGIRLEAVPDWIKADSALSLLSYNDRENIRDAEWVFCTEYEADALGTPDPDWEGSEPRGMQRSVDEKFFLISVALWLAKPSPLTCGPVLHFDENGVSESIRQSGSLRPVLIRDDENLNSLDSEDLEIARKLAISLYSLRRDATCWIATRMLVRALTESMWEARYLWQWVVLEALFGPDSPGETRHRLCQRIAFFSETEPKRRKEIFDLAKKSYDWRSKLVHGRKLSKLTPDKSKELTTFIENAIRRSFVSILSDVDLISQFDSKSRDEKLEHLVLGV